MRIDVWSDVVCPWCWLGKRRLEAALEGLEFGDDAEVHWRAFLLDPSATAEPKPLAPAIERKYGPGAFDAMTARLEPLGREAGIEYRFDRVKRVTSVPAHQLLAWAAEESGPAAAGSLHERLFQAYFRDGENIADMAVLARCAADAGFDAQLAGEVLASDAGRATVSTDLAEARERMITGVPAFVVDGTATIPGAQDVETLQRVLRRMHDRAA